MNPGGTMYHNHRPEGCGQAPRDPRPRAPKLAGGPRQHAPRGYAYAQFPCRPAEKLQDGGGLRENIPADTRCAQYSDQDEAWPRGAFLCMTRSEEPIDDARQHARQPAGYSYRRPCAASHRGLRGLCDKVIEQSERAVRFREASMRPPILWLFLIAAPLLGEIQAASAQSPTTYPWCLRYFAYDGANSCYFTSYQQCMTALAGRGGYCIKSPYYRPAPTTAPPVEQESRPARPGHRRHTWRRPLAKAKAAEEARRVAEAKADHYAVLARYAKCC
jgi:Protein of unknown function (DUF3551)